MPRGWTDPPRVAPPEERAAFAWRVHELYERRQHGLMTARAGGVVRYVGRHLRVLGPWIAFATFLVGLRWVGLSPTLRNALTGAAGVPWFIALLLGALGVGALLTTVLAVALWVYVKTRLFPTLSPPASDDREGS